MDIKTSLGFGEKGYITIFKNTNKQYDEWFRELPAKWSKYWGWYLPEGQNAFNLPYGVEPVKLKWNDISENSNLKSPNLIKQVVDNLLYDPDDSVFLGSIGDNINDLVIVKRIIPITKKNLYIIDDINNNHIIWVSTQLLEENKKYSLSCKIKGLQRYHNKKQTVIEKAKFVEVKND